MCPELIFESSAQEMDKTQLCSSEAFSSLSLQTCAPLGFYCANLLKGKAGAVLFTGILAPWAWSFRSEITARSSADSSASSWCLGSFAQTVCLLFQPCSWYPELANTLKNKPTAVCWLTLPRDSPFPGFCLLESWLPPGTHEVSMLFSFYPSSCSRGIPGLK